MSNNHDSIIKRLESRMDSLENKVKTLKQENKKLKTENKELKKEVKQLKSKLKAYENSHTPSSKRRNKKQTKGPYKKSGREKGHKGSGRAYPEPSEEIEFKEEFCPKCSSPQIEVIDIEESIQEEISKPEPVKVIKNKIYKYICKHCKTKFEAKNNVLKKSRFGINLVTEIIISKFEERLPLQKLQNRLLRRHSCYISKSGIWGIIIRVSTFLKILYKKLLGVLSLMKFLYGDETSLRVKGQNWWLWTFCNKLISIFLLRKSRGKKVLEEALQGFIGTLVSDGWKIYVQFCRSHQRCWSHLLREARDDYSHLVEGRAMIENLEALFESAKNASKISSLDERKKHYNEHIIKIKRLIAICKSHRKLRKFAGTIENGLNSWFTAILENDIEFTNNRAERELREPIVLRKIMGGLQSNQGAESFEVIMSLLMTFKKQGKDLQEAFSSSLIKSQRVLGLSGW